MTIDTSIPRTRRALLAGGLGGAAALAASALGRPLPTSAADGQAVLVGGEYTASSRNEVQHRDDGRDHPDGPVRQLPRRPPSSAPTPPARRHGQSTSAAASTARATRASASSATAPRAASTAEPSGASRAPRAPASMARAPRGLRVSTSFIGVTARATGFGILGRGDAGVVGESTSGKGVSGVTNSKYAPAILGSSGGGNTGVYGYSGVLYTEPAAPAKTGVYGYAAQDADARGVHGQSKAGRGVYGQATSGVGVYGSATTGYALRTSGRLKVDKASGVATIPATKTSITVTPGIDVTSTSFVLLTPKADLGSRRLWYTTSPTANTITIKVSTRRDGGPEGRLAAARISRRSPPGASLAPAAMPFGRTRAVARASAGGRGRGRGRRRSSG